MTTTVDPDQPANQLTTELVEAYPVDSQVTVPGEPGAVVGLRKLARGLLADCPRANDIELITGELANHSLRYGGGDITLRIRARDGYARIEISDRGFRPQFQDPDNLGLFDCSLLLVEIFAQRWGHTHTFDGTDTMWAILTWPWDDAHAIDNSPAASGDGVRHWLSYQPGTNPIVDRFLQRNPATEDPEAEET